MPSRSVRLYTAAQFEEVRRLSTWLPNGQTCRLPSARGSLRFRQI